jgi:UDP-glucose 4-epimerase
LIHLAAIAAPLECEKRPEKAFLVNVQGTYNVLKFAQRKGVRKVIFSSSAHVYGISPKYMPTDEKHPLALQDVYTTSKILGESLCQLFYSNHNLEYVTSRLYNAYGPGQNEDYFIPAMISKAKTGRIELRGRAVTKDFVFVEDVADAFVKALTSDFVGEVNIGSGRQTTLEFVADHIAKAFRAKLTFSTVEPAGPSHMQCDTERARRILGWEAKTSIEQGLDRTLAA